MRARRAGATDGVARSRLRRRLEPADVGGASATDSSKRRDWTSSSATRRIPASSSNRCSTARPTSRSPRSTTSSPIRKGRARRQSPSNPDLFAFMGGDGGFISIVASAAVGGVTDLKGRTVSVDAMTTGFAFVVRELVARNGLAEADVDVRARRRHRQSLSRPRRRQARCDAASHAVRAARREPRLPPHRERRDRSAHTRAPSALRGGAGRASTRRRSSAS